MTLRHLQGFEHIKPTTVGEVHVEAGEVRTHLGFLTPTNTAEWFVGDAGLPTSDSGPVIISSDARINGQSLQIKRPDAGDFQDTFNGRYIADFRIVTAPSFKTAVGFAVKFSKAPSSAFPLVRFSANSGLFDELQTSLWVGTEGQLFFSATAVGMDSLAPIAPNPIQVTLTDAQVLNFDAWNYIEIELNHTGAASTATVVINGAVVLDAVSSTALCASANTRTTSIAVLNVQNHYFPDNSYDMFLDDMYFVDGVGGVINGLLGPQHIILLQPDGTSQSEWTIFGGEATSHETVDGLYDQSDLTRYLESSTNTDKDILTLSNVPADVVSISAIVVSSFMSVDTGATNIRVGIEQGGNERTVTHAVNTLTPAVYNAVFQQNASGQNWTPTNLNATSLTVEVVV